MPYVLPGLLFCFWMFLAYRSLQRGDAVMAGVFVVVGIALTIYRIKAAKAKSGA